MAQYGHLLNLKACLELTGIGQLKTCCNLKQLTKEESRSALHESSIWSHPGSSVLVQEVTSSFPSLGNTEDLRVHLNDFLNVGFFVCYWMQLDKDWILQCCCSCLLTPKVAYAITIVYGLLELHWLRLSYLLVDGSHMKYPEWSVEIVCTNFRVCHLLHNQHNICIN